MFFLPHFFQNRITDSYRSFFLIFTDFFNFENPKKCWLQSFWHNICIPANIHFLNVVRPIRSKRFAGSCFILGAESGSVVPGFYEIKHKLDMLFHGFQCHVRIVFLDGLINLSVLVEYFFDVAGFFVQIFQVFVDAGEQEVVEASHEVDLDRVLDQTDVKVSRDKGKIIQVNAGDEILYKSSPPTQEAHTPIRHSTTRGKDGDRVPAHSATPRYRRKRCPKPVGSRMHAGTGDPDEFRIGKTIGKCQPLHEHYAGKRV